MQSHQSELPIETRITAGALRMRASRRRRQEGLRCITLDLRDAEIDQLIQLGHLRPDEREDNNELLWRSTGSLTPARFIRASVMHSAGQWVRAEFRNRLARVCARGNG